MKRKLKNKLNYHTPIENKHTECMYANRVSWEGIHLADALITSIVENKNYNFFLTLATNKENIDLIHLEKDLLQLRNKLCSKCFRAKKYINTETGGIEYSKLFYGYAFLEKTQSGYPHYHIVGYIHPSKLNKILHTPIVAYLWKKQFKRGNVDIQEIKNTESLKKVASYSMKDFATSDGYDNYVPF